MSKQQEPDAAPSDADKLPWSPHVRGIVSVILAFHVAAVFIAPWAGPPPSSRLSVGVRNSIGYYLDAVSMNHGYRFFAPNPGASHIVRYRAQLRDGSYQEGQFPNLEEHWPRQLYHRHFMIAERVNTHQEDVITIFPEPVPPGQRPDFQLLPRREQQRLNVQFQTAGRLHNEAKGRLEQFVRPIADRLMLEHDAVAVELWCVEHRIPFREAVVEGAKLDDPQFYVERPLGRFERQ